ncbi:Uu.00g028340.m01.CDS01 [Anthostomella pinea]|uniref:Uu.00g028340.m01.CDS01 n=1 Tax=Anthostomella pinea TaxID=933095 RepID=A0AAI8YCP6_9PEZI|nr:Uu.00g028340.m01.CDS01 [Anthostomella pinea]
MSQSSAALSGDLLTSYLQLKHGTETLAGWLVEEAVTKCAYQLNAAQAPAAAPRLKGKARKTAKAKATVNPSKSTKYTIQVSDFVPMAKAIAEVQPKIVIPRALDALFDSVIDSRRKITSFYQQASINASVEASNQRHSYFTNILTTAWETLRPFTEAREATGTSRARASEKASCEPLHKTNRFAALDVPDGVDVDPAEAIMVSSYALEKVPPVTIVRDEQGIEDDFVLALLSFACELDEVRRALVAEWTAYAEGETNLATVALLTETTIGLVRRAEQSLEDTVQRPRKYPAADYPVWTFLGILQWELRQDAIRQEDPDGLSMKDFIKPSAETGRFDGVDGSQFFFYHTYMLLKFSVWSLEYKQQPTIGNDVLENPEIKRIYDMIPVFSSMCSMVDAPVTDVITRGIQTAFKTCTVPISVTFGVHLLGEIQDALTRAGVPRRALQDVQTHVSRRNKDFQNMDIFKLRFNTRRNGSQYLRRYGEWLKLAGPYILQDGYNRNAMQYMDKLASMGAWNRDYPEWTCERDHFLVKHPVLCGLWRYMVDVRHTRWAIQFEQASLNNSLGMHLYSAIRVAFPNDRAWPDMEYLLDRQDRNWIYFGGLPKTLAEAHSKAMLGLGIPASAFARAQRRSNTVTKSAEKDGRIMRDTSHLATYFQDLTYTKPDTESTATRDEALMKLRHTLLDTKNLERIARVHQLPRRLRDRMEPGNKTTKPKNAASEDPAYCSIKGFLRVLQVYIEAESADLGFDMWALHEALEELWATGLRQVEGGAPKHRDAGMPNVLLNEVLGPASDVEALLSESLPPLPRMAVAAAAAYQVDPDDLHALAVARFVSMNTLLVHARAALQDIITCPIVGADGERDDSGEPKLWAGDESVAGLALYQNYDSVLARMKDHKALAARMYTGWSAEETTRSLVRERMLQLTSGVTTMSRPFARPELVQSQTLANGLNVQVFDANAMLDALELEDGGR